ncbi:Kef-type K+ transport system membrane component KefB [Kibdelosporangium banguiense]|uniref:Kef-type K+ transport system membrane component KefB n=1 Tax=Kibdelosporangium banguiense TaxID=1365924 RepID=A0ABS4TR13_9PSEU|nr:cation:proton antiporter [Kibdelosporangium banguiense]MBP2326390.1 Kef-type K+ transport system membrane component KefB [Kibdelosporangium banguiense]
MRVRRSLISLALIAVPVALIVIVLDLGAAYHHGSGAPAQAASGSPDPYSRLLIALPVILAVCYLMGALFRRIGQPPVIGEIFAGIIMGPSLLGLIWPGAMQWLFPSGVIGTINTLSQLGLIFFMYLVGSEINLDALRQRGFTAVTVSQVSIALPMLSGLGLAFGLYPSHGNDVGFLGFALFIAVSMSITAFPVLARILTDRGISRTPLGALALTCAAVDDIVAWCLLAVVIAIHQGGTADGVLLTIGLTIVFVALMVFVIRPLLAKWLPRVPEAAVLPIMLGGIMLSALATNEIGIHPIFGAFLFGVISPRGLAMSKRAEGKLESVTVTLLLPLFFAYTGLRTEFGLLGAEASLWGWCALITGVAMIGKWGGSTVAARLTGVGWRESLSLGALMNCRGLTELVVLNVGLQLKVITPTVFAMLVVMTLVSTVITSPALTVINRRAAADQEFLVNR